MRRRRLLDKYSFRKTPPQRTRSLSAAIPLSLPPVDGIVQAYDKTGARQPKSVEEEGSKDSNTKASAPEAKKSSEIPVKTRSSSTVKKPSSAGGGSTAKRRRTAAAAATTTTTTRIRQPPGAPRRRIGKKDRHSKIFTAHGPRDRRMRLSLQIASKDLV